MTTQTKVLKMALEALDGWRKGFPDHWGDIDEKAVDYIKEALAQPEQEPVAWKLESGQAIWFERTDPEAASALPPDVTMTPLYTTPPQRKEPEQEPWLLETTQTLAKHMAREFYPEVTQWQCLDNLAGVISQIDNMTTGLMRKPEQEPVAYFGSSYVNQNGVHVTTVLGPVAIPQDAKLYTTPPQQKKD